MNTIRIKTIIPGPRQIEIPAKRRRLARQQLVAENSHICTRWMIADENVPKANAHVPRRTGPDQDLLADFTERAFAARKLKEGFGSRMKVYRIVKNIPRMTGALIPPGATRVLGFASAPQTEQMPARFITTGGFSRSFGRRPGRRSGRAARAGAAGVSGAANWMAARQ